ncbi:MAG: hypothetical protein ACMG6E_06710 [Candidatus Roizmanbacteria bacterium]
MNSVIVVGGASKSFMQANKTFTPYNLTSNSSYNIALDGFGAGTNYTFVNSTIAKAANNTNEAQFA